jgi:hypothetical protein
MRRHLIVARFGPLDRTPVATAKDERVTRLDLVAAQSRLDHGLGQAIEDLAKLKLFPTEVAIDLAVLAALVHAADTRVSRSTESQDSWTREIRLVVPVSNPSLWVPSTGLVQRLLNFLTGDRWTVGFRVRPERFTRIVPARAGRLVPLPFDSVTLFSGGLDSLVGAIDALQQGAVPLLVSHAGDGATSAAQNACFDALRAHYTGRPFERFRVWMTFPKTLVRRSAPENTTRSRSFLFFALGIFGGTGLGRPFTVRAPENGLIALNVPLDPLRLGSNSTRTTHPFYIALWNELLAALSIQARIENPYWDRTKGEMVAACSNSSLLRSLIPSSLSCSSPTKGRWLKRGVEHCGYCLPCLIRRAALAKAFGAAGDPTRYTLQNLKRGVLDTRQAEGQQVRSFQHAIAKLKARPELAHLLIHKPGPLPDTDSLADLADVYVRGMREVEELLAGTRTAPR